jgi:hypothetical protein
MADLTKLLEALGFGASTITVAATVYGVFKFLDTKASGPAKAAIIGWIKDENYKRVDLKASVVSSFDHLYGMPLWSVKASITITNAAVAQLEANARFFLAIARAEAYRPARLVV